MHSDSSRRGRDGVPNAGRPPPGTRAPGDIDYPTCSSTTEGRLRLKSRVVVDAPIDEAAGMPCPRWRLNGIDDGACPLGVGLATAPGRLAGGSRGRGQAGEASRGSTA